MQEYFMSKSVTVSYCVTHKNTNKQCGEQGPLKKYSVILSKRKKQRSY